MPRIMAAVSGAGGGAGGYPAAVTTRVHSSITPQTSDGPEADLAIAPARDLVKLAIVALITKPKNLAHIIATMASLIWTGMPPASRAFLIAAQRSEARPSSSPIALRLIRIWLCWIVPPGIRAALIVVRPPSTRA